MKRFTLWASLVGFAIVVVVSMSWNEFGFWALRVWVEFGSWAARVGDFVWKSIGWAILVGLAIWLTLVAVTPWRSGSVSDTFFNYAGWVIFTAFCVMIASFAIVFIDLFVVAVISSIRVWAGRVGESVGWAILAGIAIYVILDVVERAWRHWSFWWTWNKRIKVSGLDQNAATGQKFRRIIVLGPDEKVIVRVTVYETGRVVVARPDGSPTGLGERIIISPTFQVKRSIWHDDEESWETFELVKGELVDMGLDKEN